MSRARRVQSRRAENTAYFCIGALTGIIAGIACCILGAALYLNTF